MKSISRLIALLCAFFLLTGVLFAAEKEKSAKKQTCCEKAVAEKKECSHKCCITAHRATRSCEKCNPAKEDLLALKKKTAPKTEERAQK